MRLKDILSMIVVILLFLSGSILATIVMTPIFMWHISSINTISLLELTAEQVVANYHELINYLINPFVKNLYLPNFKMSTEGTFHFFEVKQLFLLNNIIFICCLIGSIFIFKYIKKENRWFVFHMLTKITAMFLPVVAIVLAIGFDYWFILFHHIIFNNESWLFNPLTDPIILVLTENFFLICAIIVILFFELLLIMLWRYCRKQRTLSK